MKCRRGLCRAEMTPVGDDTFVCSDAECGAVVRQWDVASHNGLSASSKPSSAEERSTKSRLVHERAQATRRRIRLLADEGFSSEAIASAISVGVRGGVQHAAISAEYVEEIIRERSA